ncbi:MAG: glycogen-binding domain-containing protein, partial [Candidatus Marinimicrobia bacterium]|nr:glycogen-binding domain-containing protein [Candidatus Neomarinimicrobiota bacterium]
TNSYWDTERSRILHSAAGEGKSADAMLTDPSTFAGWNTEAHWRIESGSYPFLQWQGEPGPQNRPQELLPDHWLIFHLDMNNVESGFENSVDKVYISGNMQASTGLDWPEPGSQPAYELQYAGGGFWTIGFRVMPGTYEYKFFINNGWERGEWIGEPNRCVTVNDLTVVNDVWALMPDTSALEMYYPNSVITFSSEFQDSTMFPGAWSAQQLLGPPDAYPYHDVKSGLVWNPETADGQREFVELGFETPVYASGVMIYETFGAGAVDTVYVRNADDGSWHNVWSGYAGSMHSISRIFPVMFEQTAFMVDAVRLAINSPAVSGYQEYDAVALAGSTESGASAEWAIRLGASRAEHGDPENYLGVAADALDAFDDRDIVEAPPAPETPIALYFPHPEWEHALGDNFCSDYRPSGQPLYVWNFEVYSADTGTVLLDAEYFSVPEELPVLLEDLHSGAQQLMSDAGTYAYFSAAAETRAFRVTVGDTTEPLLILGESCSGPRILKAGSEYLLDWSITGAFDLSSVDILLSKDDALYERITTLGAEYDYLWTLPDLMLVREAKLLLIAVSGGGDTLMAASDHPFAIAGDLMEIDIPAGWLLWGMPMLPVNSSMSENLADDLTEYYVVYDYFGGTYRFADILKEAAGYWLGSLAAATVTVGGEPFTDPYDLALERGWNLISNPLVTDVDIDSLVFMKDDQVKTRAQALSAGWINGMYACDSPDSGYYAPEALELCRGYWLSVLEENIWVQFPIHRDPVPAPAPMHKSGSSDAMIDFIAESGTLQNEMLRIGILAEASAGFDPAFDAVAPPPPPMHAYLELYVPRPDLNSVLGNKFVRDIRAIPAEGAYEE